jgi:molybdate transport system substrate-binding protein
MTSLKTGLQVASLAMICCLLSITQLSAQKTETTGPTVFAAASLKTALDKAAAAFLESTGKKVTVSYAGSSALAKQIEQAAPADMFISADLEWMNYLAKKGLIKDESRFNFLGNRLVLIAPSSSATALKIAPSFALSDAVGDGKLAVADVKAVPAGKYAKVALEKLGVWTTIEGKLAQAENVRAALALVAREEAQLGIVYQTDAKAEAKVKIVDTFPEDSHPPIIYPVALTSGAANAADAGAFATFLRDEQAKKVFLDEGFTILK